MNRAASIMVTPCFPNQRILFVKKLYVSDKCFQIPMLLLSSNYYHVILFESV